MVFTGLCKFIHRPPLYASGKRAPDQASDSVGQPDCLQRRRVARVAVTRLLFRLKPARGVEQAAMVVREGCRVGHLGCSIMEVGPFLDTEPSALPAVLGCEESGRNGLLQGGSLRERCRCPGA